MLSLLDGRLGTCQIVDYEYDTAEQSWCRLTLGFDIGKKRIDMTNVLRKAAAKASLNLFRTSEV